MAIFSHFDESGASRMVDVSQKETSLRTARATATIRMRPDTLRTIRDTHVNKGNVWEVARLAGIMAAKRTSDTIPLCHQVPLSSVQIDFYPRETDSVTVEATVKTNAQTGVEMEALTAVSVAALTVYDMCKSFDRGMVIEVLQLEEKSGGRSGHFLRESGTRPGLSAEAPAGTGHHRHGNVPSTPPT